MEYIATRISQWFLKKGYIVENQIDDIRYALEVVISNVLPFITILFLGFKLNQYIKMILFLLIFIGFRTLRDRYHAPTFVRCYLLTVGSFLLCLAVSLIIQSEDQFRFTSYVAMLNIFILILFIEKINDGQTVKSNTLYNSILVLYNLGCMVLSMISLGEYTVFSSVLGTIIIATSIARQKGA